MEELPEAPGPSDAKRKRKGPAVKSETLSDDEDDEEDEKSLEVGPADAFCENICLKPTIGATCFTSGPPGEEACQEGAGTGQAGNVAHPRPVYFGRRGDRFDLGKVLPPACGEDFGFRWYCLQTAVLLVRLAYHFSWFVVFSSLPYFCDISLGVWTA